MSKYFVTFETTIWYLWELRLSRECPVGEASPSDASGVVSRMATTINKCLALESNCETQAAFVVHYHNSDTRAERATKGEIRVTKRRRIASRHGSKKTWVALPNWLPTRMKGSFTQYLVIYVMILPLGITAGRTRILPTIELNSLPLLIKEYCAVWTVTNNSPGLSIHHFTLPKCACSVTRLLRSLRRISTHLGTVNRHHVTITTQFRRAMLRDSPT